MQILENLAGLLLALGLMVAASTIPAAVILAMVFGPWGRSTPTT